MGSQIFLSSYQGYTILICLMSGLLLLGVDAPSYKTSKLLKEQKTARILGWINLLLGGAAILAKMVMLIV